MRKSTLKRILLPIGFVAVVFLSCKDDAFLTVPPPLPDASFVEEFDTMSAAYDRGWRYFNVSDPKGDGFWVQGLLNNPTLTGFPKPIPFPAYSSKGSYVGYIGADFTCTSAAAGVISAWVVSPITLMKNGDKISFYTRAVILAAAGGDSTDYGNRLQVLFTPQTETINVGTGVTQGDFTDVLLDINPFYKQFHTTPSLYEPTAYPATWTRFEATVAGLNRPTRGRFAFRYFVEGGGSNGLATAVAIDLVTYKSVK